MKALFFDGTSNSGIKPVVRNTIPIPWDLHCKTSFILGVYTQLNTESWVDLSVIGFVHTEDPPIVLRHLVLGATLSWGAEGLLLKWCFCRMIGAVTLTSHKKNPFLNTDPFLDDYVYTNACHPGILQIWKKKSELLFKSAPYLTVPPFSTRTLSHSAHTVFPLILSQDGKLFVLGNRHRHTIHHISMTKKGPYAHKPECNHTLNLSECLLSQKKKQHSVQAF